uniref:Uncharacterized protein n=1 Tax=Rhizophora mucronata TaxID=61149 RepID=A0A2P2JE47_RHIMU
MNLYKPDVRSLKQKRSMLACQAPIRKEKVTMHVDQRNQQSLAIQNVFNLNQLDIKVIGMLSIFLSNKKPPCFFFSSLPTDKTQRNKYYETV